MLSLFYQKFLSSTVILTILATYRAHANTITVYGRAELDTVSCKNRRFPLIFYLLFEVLLFEVQLYVVILIKIVIKIF